MFVQDKRDKKALIKQALLLKHSDKLMFDHSCRGSCEAGYEELCNLARVHSTADCPGALNNVS